MKELVMYRCPLCGNLICMVKDSGVVPVCCGQEMEKVTANTADASAEKHVPVIRQHGTRVQVTVGETAHPMLDNHHIEWICILTARGAYVRSLESSDMPEAVFEIRLDEDVLSAYAMCNLHGLWRKDA